MSKRSLKNQDKSRHQDHNPKIKTKSRQIKTSRLSGHPDIKTNAIPEESVEYDEEYEGNIFENIFGI